MGDRLRQRGSVPDQVQVSHHILVCMAPLIFSSQLCNTLCVHDLENLVYLYVPSYPDIHTPTLPYSHTY